MGARRPSTCWDGKAGTYPGLIQAGGSDSSRLGQAQPGTYPGSYPGAYPGSTRQQADESRGEVGGEGGAARKGGSRAGGSWADVEDRADHNAVLRVRGLLHLVDGLAVVGLEPDLSTVGPGTLDTWVL
jgi:hypothetical protein